MDYFESVTLSLVRVHVFVKVNVPLTRKLKLGKTLNLPNKLQFALLLGTQA